MENEFEREILYSIRRQNLFIIRELVQFIGIKEKTSIKYYYYYLFNDLIKDKKNIMKKCSDRYAHLLFDTGKNNISLIKEKYIECGISPEYFDNQPIIFSDNSHYSLKGEIKEYLSHIRGNGNVKASEIPKGCAMDDIEGELTYLRQSISEKYCDIKNIDGSLMIDSIRLLVNKIIRYSRDNPISISEQKKVAFEEIDNFTQSLPFALALESLSFNTKNIYLMKKSSINIKINYLLIRTIFEMLCEMDELILPEKFYSLIGISKQDYDNIIISGICDNKMLASILRKYNFPSSMFRGDNPSCIKIHPTLKKIAQKRINNEISNDEYLQFVREQILYINHVENSQLVLSVYAMYQDALSPQLM